MAAAGLNAADFQRRQQDATDLHGQQRGGFQLIPVVVWPQPAGTLSHQAHAPDAQHLVPLSLFRVRQLREPIGKILAPQAPEAVSELHGQGATLSSHGTRPEVEVFLVFATERWQAFVCLAMVVFVLVFVCLQECVKNLADERLMFRHLCEQEHSRRGFLVVFDHVKFSADGGLNKVGQLIPQQGPGGERLVFFVMNVAAVAFNTTYLVYVNRMIIGGWMRSYRGEALENLPLEVQRYLTLTSSIGIISMNHALIVAMAELIGLLSLVTFAGHRIVVFLLRRSKPGVKFDAYAGLFDISDAFYYMSTFSALWLFNFIHPSLVGRDFEVYMTKPFFGHSAEARLIHAVWFVILRILALIVGVLAFGEKLAFVCMALYTPLQEPFSWCVLRRWCIVSMLLVQTMGAVLLDRVLKFRIILLLTGGEDAELDAEENVMRQIYLAKLGQVMWEEYWEKCKRGSRGHRRFSFVVLMLTFSDRDLQKLLLDEDTTVKRRRMQEYRRMLQTAHRDARPMPSLLT